MIVINVRLAAHIALRCAATANHFVTPFLLYEVQSATMTLMHNRFVHSFFSKLKTRLCFRKLSESMNAVDILFTYKKWKNSAYTQKLTSKT